MDAVTYPDNAVSEYIAQNLIPLRIPHNHPDYAKEFKIKWTPTLIVMDSDGREGHRVVGFLSPEELIPVLQLGIGKVHFEAGQYDKAIAALDKLLDRHPKSVAAPEALFFRGVSTYKHSGKPRALREAYDKLTAQFPDNEWTKKAYPYRLIE
jgi:tetratricopeptide (TPR) repeat protein